MHLYGFEGEVEDRDPALRIRTFIFNPTLTRQHVFIEGAPKALEPVRAMVHLNSRIDGGREEELPLEPPWVEMADESGLAVFTVPTGEYRIRFYVSGVGEDQGIIRVRGVEGDSIHAYLIPGAICNQ